LEKESYLLVAIETPKKGSSDGDRLTQKKRGRGEINGRGKIEKTTRKKNRK